MQNIQQNVNVPISGKDRRCFDAGYAWLKFRAPALLKFQFLNYSVYMPIYTKESLEKLRQSIDLVEVLSGHLQLHKSGASYKSLCPFHEERTPSFIVQKADTHYHCFGCGAHGDAIAFLMGHVKMSFMEAVEHLADRFQVTLERTDTQGQRKGPSKAELKEALSVAARFYHFSLLHTPEAKAALDYLDKRGIDATFIRQFQIGYATNERGLFQSVMHKAGFRDEVLEEAGLMLATESGRKRDFFFDRITFPICDATGAVIGFSARKYKEETFGGKYINTSETPLFKKSHVLFGLSYARRRIAKEKRAIIVEGQVDALRLIQTGFNFTVAAQGTAFGEGHVKELMNLGVTTVYLALDGDDAGREAALKIGDLFQKKGIAVSVAELPEESDPDSLLREKGPEAFMQLLEKSIDYLPFMVKQVAKSVDFNSPAGKNSAVEEVLERIRKWEHPVMVHESLRKVAPLLQVPQSVLGLSQELIPTRHVKKASRISFTEVNPDRILETDLLRWLFLLGETHPKLVEMAQRNLTPAHFRIEGCRHLFSLYLELAAQNKPRDLFSLGISIDQPEEQIILSYVMEKKINFQRADEGVKETIERILQRKWMEEREAITAKIQSGTCSDDEVFELAKQFDALKGRRPLII